MCDAKLASFLEPLLAEAGIEVGDVPGEVADLPALARYVDDLKKKIAAAGIDDGRPPLAEAPDFEPERLAGFAHASAMFHRIEPWRQLTNIDLIRSLCDKYGIVMIFDEVKTGFRIAKGGAQEYFNIKADLVTYAKALANGFPLAAIAGKKEIMGEIGYQKIAHGGTYCANVVATAAAYRNWIGPVLRRLPLAMYKRN